MRKKIIFCIILLVICLFSTMAADPSSFYKQLPGMFMVNLKNSDIYVSHTSNAYWAGYTATSSDSAGGYYDNQLIAVLGIRDATEDVTFTVSLESGNGEWVYLLDPSDNTISRPFGIDLIIKGRPDNYVDLYGDGCVVHMGLQDANTGTYLSPTSTQGKGTSFTIPASKLSSYQNTMWMDIALVLPELTDSGSYTSSVTGKTYTAKASETPYTATLKIKVESGEFKDEYTLDLSGIYSSSTDSSKTYSAVMLVTPTAAAKSLDIAGMTKSNSSISVAKFSFSTTSVTISNGNSEKDAYIFLSSSATGSTTGEKFKLRRLRSDGTYSPDDSKYNSITYEAILKSTVDGRTTEVAFDGTTSTSSGSSSFYAVDASTMTDHQNTTQWVRWYDDGEILIRIAPDSSEDYTQLAAGKYTSTIYIHVETV